MSGLYRAIQESCRGYTIGTMHGLGLNWRDYMRLLRRFYGDHMQGRVGS